MTDMMSKGASPDRAVPAPPPTPPPAAMSSADSVRAMLLTRRRSAPARVVAMETEVVTRTDRLERELAATKTRMERAEYDKTQLEARVWELVDDKTQLHVRLSAALADIRALEAELSTASLQGYRAMLDMDAGDRNADLDVAALRRENAKLKASLKKLRGQSSNRQQCSRERVVAAETKSKQLATEVESLKRRLRFLESASREDARSHGKKKTPARTRGHATAGGGRDQAPSSHRQTLPSSGRHDVTHESEEMTTEAAANTTQPRLQHTRATSSAGASLKPAWK